MNKMLINWNQIVMIKLTKILQPKLIMRPLPRKKVPKKPLKSQRKSNKKELLKIPWQTIRK